MLLPWLASLALCQSPTLDGVRFIAQGPSPHAPLTLVEVWATWCGPCHETFADLSALQAEHGDALRVVALTDDPDRAVRRFFAARREQMRFAVAVDPTAEIVKGLMFGGYGGRGLPSLYLLRDGEVIWGGAPEEASKAVSDALAPPTR